MAINRDKSLFFRIENPRVGGSIPPLATMKFRYLFRNSRIKFLANRKPSDNLLCSSGCMF